MSGISATVFKAKCLKILDDVSRSGQSVVITKRGKAVARLVPFVEDDAEFPQERLRGKIRILGDIVSPVLDTDQWSVFSDGELK